MNCYGITDIGKKRSSNQDCFSVILPELPNFNCILTVCDGMGGANGGEIASKTAIDVYNRSLSELLSECDGDGAVLSAMSRAAHLANSAVFSASTQSPELEGMGTTLISVLCPENTGAVYLLNVGDSRAYLVGEKEIKQISHDHSYVQHLVDIGELSPSKAASHPDRNLITRAIGIEPEVIPDAKRIDTTGYTYLLLCSDGLHGTVKEADIKKIITSDPSDVKSKAEALVALANKKGGGDNITVILAQLSED